MFTDPVIICYEEMQDLAALLQRLGVENLPFQERLAKTSLDNLADMVFDHEWIRSSGDYMISLPRLLLEIQFNSQCAEKGHWRRKCFEFI